VNLPEIKVPPDLAHEDMPDLLRHWYLGPRARRHMMMRRFLEVDRHLDRARGTRVLDVGSAWGFNVMALERMGFRATGVDLIPAQFPVGQRIAAHNGVAFDVAAADASALPFADATFDFLTMVETFEHIYNDDRPRALAECRRVLKPGGRLVLSTPNHSSVVERMKRVAVRHGWMRQRLPSIDRRARRSRRFPRGVDVALPVHDEEHARSSRGRVAGRRTAPRTHSRAESFRRDGLHRRGLRLVSPSRQHPAGRPYGTFPPISPCGSISA
jgi:SAM-dependent methyltransferase